MINIEKIIEMIPHRYPFLLVDRVQEIELDHKITAIKNVTMNEPHFMGHFPGKPVMPGVLIIEAMAQTSALLVVATLGDKTEGKIVYFMSIEEGKFRKPVTPGDRMEMVVEKIKNRGAVWKFKGQAFVDGNIVAEAIFTAMIADR